MEVGLGPGLSLCPPCYQEACPRLALAILLDLLLQGAGIPRGLVPLILQELRLSQETISLSIYQSQRQQAQLNEMKSKQLAQRTMS